MPRIAPISVLFDEKHMPEPNSGCFIWLGATRGNNYGCFGTGKRVDRAAHRAAWQLSKGPIPDGLQVLHKCDNTLCVNTNHLFLGTVLDNMQDRDRKGRNGLLTHGMSGDMDWHVEYKREWRERRRAAGLRVT